MSDRATRKPLFILLVIILIVACSVTLYVQLVVKPFVNNVLSETVKNVYSDIVAKLSAELKVSKEFSETFFEYQKNSDGEIVAVLSNGYAINQVNFLVQKKVFEQVSQLVNYKIPVRLGAFSGVSFFSDFGPEVYLDVLPIGSVRCRFCSEYKAEGLNQTIHKFYVRVYTTIALSLPIEKISFEEFTDVFIAENLIVGRVPDTYLEGKDTTDYLDLVP